MSFWSVRLLVLVAAIASIVNAQCVVSCSLQGVLLPVTAAPKLVSLHQQDHSCCPRKSAPVSPASRDSCPHPAIAADQALFDAKSGVAPVLSMHAAILPLPVQVAPLAPETVFSVSGGAPPLHSSPLSTIRILRV